MKYQISSIFNSTQAGNGGPGITFKTEVNILWTMPLVQAWLLHLMIYNPVHYHCAMASQPLPIIPAVNTKTTGNELLEFVLPFGYILVISIKQRQTMHSFKDIVTIKKPWTTTCLFTQLQERKTIVNTLVQWITYVYGS